VPTFHPDLAAARFIPNLSVTPRVLRFMRTSRPAPAPPEDVRIEEVVVPGVEGAPPTSARVYRPAQAQPGSPAMPALLWLHGGGFLLGSPEQDEASSIGFVRELGITVVAARYRLAPEHPAPAAVEDAYSSLQWLVANAGSLGVDPERVAIGGASAGGGLAAALSLYAHDRGIVRPAFQLLVYPMLDDRTVTRDDLDGRGVRAWTPGSNRFAWTSYLRTEPGSDDVSPYAAPARRTDLSGLPPAWVGVGTLDLFHDEDLVYAARLVEAGVPCEVRVIEGAFHGFDAIFRRAGISRTFWREQADALRRALLH
jgi:acetyl esterase/lipase